MVPPALLVPDRLVSRMAAAVSSMGCLPSAPNRMSSYSVKLPARYTFLSPSSSPSLSRTASEESAMISPPSPKANTASSPSASAASAAWAAARARDAGSAAPSAFHWAYRVSDSEGTVKASSGS